MYRLRDLREDHDLTQTQVAQLLHMSQTGYSKYETGENDIPTRVLVQLADYYNTSVDYLLGRTEQVQPYPRGKIKKGSRLKAGALFAWRDQSSGSICRFLKNASVPMSTKRPTLPRNAGPWSISSTTRVGVEAWLR